MAWLSWTPTSWGNFLIVCNPLGPQGWKTNLDKNSKKCNSLTIIWYKKQGFTRNYNILLPIQVLIKSVLKTICLLSLCWGIRNNHIVPISGLLESLCFRSSSKNMCCSTQYRYQLVKKKEKIPLSPSLSSNSALYLVNSL